MSTSSRILEAQTVAQRLVDEPITSLNPAGSGANSNVYCVETNTRRLALKMFPTRKGDQRNRVKAEWEALSFMHRHGIHTVPEPVARDETLNAIVFGWIDGDPVTLHNESDLNATLDFISDIFRISDEEDAKCFPPASEACLSSAEIVRQINNRLETLTDLPKIGTFLDETFLPIFHLYCEENAADLEDEMELDVSLQRLIPADFGFHNTLKANDNRLGFVDFDYFGWDDPAKMAVDFMIHPAHQLSTEEKSLVKNRLAESLSYDTEFLVRIEHHAPLYALRWALILLNAFRQDRMNPQEIETSAFSELLERQLTKAIQFCGYASEFRE